MLAVINWLSVTQRKQVLSFCEDDSKLFKTDWFARQIRSIELGDVLLSFHISVINQCLKCVHICSKWIIRKKTNKHQCSPPSLARPSVSSAAPPLSISSVSAPRSCSLHFWDAGISGTRVARQRLKETQKLTTYLRAAGKSSESLLWWKERETVSSTGKNRDQLKGEKILAVIFAFANHILHILFMGLMFTCVMFMCFACDTEKDKIINRSWKRFIYLIIWEPVQTSLAWQPTAAAKCWVVALQVQTYYGAILSGSCDILIEMWLQKNVFLAHMYH